MSPAPLKLQKDKRDAVKRLIRVGNSYVCGICRSSHDSKEIAMACLQRCATGYFSDQAPKDKPKGNRTVYRCRFCCRNYESKQTALACVRKCREEMQSRFQTEHHKPSVVSLIDLNKAASLAAFADKNLILEACAELLSHPVAKKAFPQSTSYICSECGQSYATTREVEACKKVHSLDEVPETISIDAAASERSVEKTVKAKAPPVDDFSADAMNEDEDEQVMPEIGEFGGFDFEHDGQLDASEMSADAPVDQAFEDESNEDSDIDPFYEKAVSLEADTEKKKFARKDARYECRACLERYFTKAEVLECFDKHLNGGPKS